MMKPAVYYFETGSHDPYYNLAFEEYLLCQRTDKPFLILWQNDNTIVIGQNQNPCAEIDFDFIRSHHTHIIRRTTGGGSVYHDLGNLNYSFISTCSTNFQKISACLLTLMAEALKGLGLPAVISGKNDIIVNGYKVSGTAQRLHRSRILHHGTLLFDSDLSFLSRALTPDPLKRRPTETGSVPGRVCNIRPLLKTDMILKEFWLYIKNHLTGSNYISCHLTDDDRKAILKLKQEKYMSWSWTFRETPDFTLASKRKWPGGILEVFLSIQSGNIQTIHFRGDFLSCRTLSPLENAFKNCPYQKQEILDRLSRYPLEEFFGAIQKEEIADTIIESDTRRLPGIRL